MFTSEPVNIAKLLEAVQSNALDDTLARFIPESDWVKLAPYLYPQDISKGHILTARGALDRTLYFLEKGNLVVHYENAQRTIVIATVQPGSVVGEGAFFSQIERNATVQASLPSRVWALTPNKFDQLRKVEPQTALTLAMALGAVVSSRMLDVTKRVAIT